MHDNCRKLENLNLPGQIIYNVPENIRRKATHSAGENMQKTLIILFIFLVLTTPAFSNDYSGDANFQSTYESAGGRVTFSHALHAEKFHTECNFCHSALRTFGGVSPIYGHKICKFCHEKNGGPTGCGACHDSDTAKSKN